MKITVVSDNRGRIISLSVPGDIKGGISGIARGGILPQPGQYIDTIELPPEFEKQPLNELHHLLRVEHTEKAARFVKIEEFKEPFLRESKE
jgi:hypothetical protein